MSAGCATALTGRPQIVFEYSEEAKARGLELSSYLLPLGGPGLRKDFPRHQLGLPGPVYDALAGPEYQPDMQSMRPE